MSLPSGRPSMNQLTSSAMRWSGLSACGADQTHPVVGMTGRAERHEIIREPPPPTDDQHRPHKEFDDRACDRHKRPRREDKEKMPESGPRPYSG